MKASVAEIKAGYNSADKAEDDAVWMVKYFVRPLSFYFSYFFVRINVSANGATVISLILGLIGCSLLAFGDRQNSVIGCALLLGWLVLDHVDGNLARFYKTQSMFGDFLDTIACYTVLALFPLGLGIGSAVNYMDANPDLALWMAGLGGIASILNILPRLFYQKMRGYRIQDGSYQAAIGAKKERGLFAHFMYFAYSFAQNLINPSGFLFVLSLLAVLLEQVPVFLTVYTFILIGGFVVFIRNIINIIKGY